MAKQRDRGKNTKKHGFFAFVKSFFIWIIIFTVVMIPGRMLVDKIGESRIFSGTESLMSETGTNVDPDSPLYKEFSKSKRVNVLVLGLHDELSDTILLASYDMKHDRVDVISVPRDTYYERPEATTPATKKINAIYRKGRAVGTAKAVSKLLVGVPIHYYAVVTFDGVEKIIDSIGGVPMNIEKRMKYYDPDDKPPLRIDIPAGEQVLDGDKAVQFLRYRKGYSEGDIGRIKAQQEFIKSAFKESLGFGLPKVVKTTLKNVDSDLKLRVAMKMTAKATGLNDDSIVTHIVPGESHTKNGASYWIADEDGILEMMREIYTYNGE